MSSSPGCPAPDDQDKSGTGISGRATRRLTLEPIDTETVDTHLLPRKGMSYGNAFMDNIAFSRSGL